MKNTLLAILALFVFSTALQAQEFGFKKGDKFVEGSIHNQYYNDKEYGEKSRNLTIRPSFGYFINDKVAVGASLMFADMLFEEAAGNQLEEVHGFGLGVFGRYYFLNLGSRFKTYSQLALGYGSSHVNSTDNGVVTESPDFKSYTLSGTLGFNFFITKNLAINYELSNVLDAFTGKENEAGAKRRSEFEINLNQFNNIFSESKFGLSYRF